MYVLSSPSGAGKTTIARQLIKQNKSLTVSISMTTRPQREGEVHGQDYYFVDIPTFNKMIENEEILEYAKVFDNYYGTPRQPVEDSLSQGKDVIFDIDWQGTQQLSELAPNDLVTVFILPPSHEELEKRLRNRAKETKETEDQIFARMTKAASEISHYSEYNYVIINKDIETSVIKAQTILDAERMKRHRLTGTSTFVRGLMEGL